MKNNPYENWPEKQQEAGGYVEICVFEMVRKGKRNHRVRSLAINVPRGKRGDRLFKRFEALMVKTLKEAPDD